MKNRYYIIILFILLFPINIYAESRAGSVTGEYGTYNDAIKIIQEVMRDYYIKEDLFQYNYSRATYGKTSPEDATVQDTKHFVCAAYTYSTYVEAFGVDNADDKFPNYNYAITNAGATYYNENKNNASALDGHYLIYYEKKNDSKYIYQNKTAISDFSQIIQPGDLFTYTGHAMIAYKVVERTPGNWDVLMLNSSANKLVNTRIDGTSKLYYDIFPSSHGTNNFLNVSKEGTVRYFWLSEHSKFVHDGQLSCQKEECTVIRPFYKGSNNKAVFNYSILPEKYNKSMLRTEYPGLYIEKTVDKLDNNSVYLNDELKYTITIKNKSNTTGTGSNYGKFYITEEVGNEVDITNTTNGNVSNNKITFVVDSLNVGETKNLTYTVKVKNDLGNIGKTITATGNFKKDLNSSVSISTGVVENKIIPITKSIKKEYSTCYNEYKDSKKGLALIDSIYDCTYGKDFNFDEFNFEELFTKKKITGKGTANAIVFKDSLNNKNLLYKKMILNDLWSGIVEFEQSTDDDDSASDEDDESVYTLPRWAGDVASTRARNINPSFFKEGDVLIYSIDYGSTEDRLKHTKENGVYAFIYINGKFVGVNGSGNTSRDEFTYKYYQDKSLDIDTHLYSGYSSITDNNEKATVLTNANYLTLFDKDYYVILRPEQAIQELVRIMVNKKPNKTIYNPNDQTLSLEGGEITCFYNDGSFKVVEMTNKNVKVTGFETNELGEKVLTVTYNGKTTSFKISVENKSNEELVPIPNTAAFKNGLLTVIAIILLTSGSCIISKQLFFTNK